MTSLISASPIATGQVQSLDSFRAHSLPSDAMILASATQVLPANQNPGSYSFQDSGINSITSNVTGSIPTTTLSPFADLYKEGSLYFTPGSNYMNLVYSSSTTNWYTTGMTVEAWVNYPTFTGASVSIGSTPVAIQLPYLMGVMQIASSGLNWCFGSNVNGYVTFGYNSSSTQSVMAQTPLSVNTWNHIAVSVAPSGFIYIFINGVQSQVVANRNGTLQSAAYYETVQGTPSTSSYPLSLGTFNSFSPTLNAYVADIRITTGAGLYTGSTSSYATFTVPSAPLSPSATGATQFLLRAGQNSPTIQSGALTFDRGLRQYMNFGPQTFNVVTQGFTAIWRGQFTGTLANSQRLFDFVNGSTQPGTANNILVGLSGTSFYAQIQNSGSGTTAMYTTGITVTTGTTYVLTFMYNPNVGSGTMYFFVNGVFNNSLTNMAASIGSDRTLTFTGLGRSAYSSDPYTSMSMNTFAVYNRALSNAEIYNSYLALTTTPVGRTIEIGDVNGTPALSVAGDGKVFMDSVGLMSNVLPWPPAAMTGYDTVINGGVYKARASSENSGSLAWYAFDKSIASAWNWNFSVLGNLYPGGAGITYGNYIGTASTSDVQGTVYKGEWVQLQLPTRILLSSYSVYGFNTQYDPGTFFVLGSNDGLNWTLVSSQVFVPWTTNGQTLTFQAQTTQTFSYFRMVLGAIMSSGTNNYSLPFGEWILYGTADTSPALTIAPATTFATSVATPALTGVSGDRYVPQDFSSSGLNIPAYVVSNTATTANTVQYSSFGPFAGEGSLYFPGGTGAFVALGPQTPPNFALVGSTCTFEFWFYPLLSPGVGGVTMAHGSTTASAYDWLTGIDAGTNKISWYNGSTTVLSSSTVNYNAWNHASYSITGGNIYIGLNGTINPGSLGSPAYTTNYSLCIGSAGRAAAGVPCYISNHRIISGLALYQSAYTPPTGPLQPIQGTTQAGLPYGTVLLLRNAPAPGRVLTQKFSGANSGAVLAFPPAAMTSNATTISSGYGQGLYIINASATFSGTYPFNAFNKNTTDSWGGLSGQYSAAGLYVGGNPPKTVDVTGNSYTGDWIQLQMPSAIILSSYSIYYNTALGCPGIFYILGSSDGTNWYLVDQRTQAQPSSSGYITFSVSSAQAFTIFRLQAYGITTGGGTMNVPELVYNGTIESINVTTDGRVGLGVVAPTRALEVSGDVVCGGTVSSGNPLMFRNRIINGDMRIAQRGTSTTSAGYTPDRWYNNQNVGNMTVSQSINVPTGQGFSNSVSIVINATVASGTSGAWNFNQPIEGYNVADFGFGSPSSAGAFTVSFWLTSSLAGTMTVTLMNSSDTRSYLTSINVGTTWQKYTLTIPVDPGATSINTTTGRALNLLFVFQSGSSTTTANQWLASQTFWLSNTTNYMVNGTTINITGVQLEKGTVATPFEFRPYGVEVQLCQRYYESSYGAETTPGTANQYQNFAIGRAYTTSFVRGVIPYRVAKRGALNTVPTCQVYSFLGTAGKISIIGVGMSDIGNTLTVNATIAGQLQITDSATAFTIGDTYFIGWTVNAEL